MATVLSGSGAGVRDIVRLFIGQANETTAVYPTNADLLIHINAAYRWWFTNMEKRVKDVQLKATMAQGAWVVTPETSVVYPEVVEAYLVGALGDDEIPLQVRPWSEVRLRQKNVTTQGTPALIGLRRVGGASPTGGNQNLWEFCVFPLPDQTYQVRALVRDYPTALSADSDVLYLGDYECRCVAMLAAIFAAPGAARQDLAERLMWFFPQAVRDKLQAHLNAEVMAA